MLLKKNISPKRRFKCDGGWTASCCLYIYFKSDTFNKTIVSNIVSKTKLNLLGNSLRVLLCTSNKMFNSYVNGIELSYNGFWAALFSTLRNTVARNATYLL